MSTNEKSINQGCPRPRIVINGRFLSHPPTGGGRRVTEFVHAPTSLNQTSGMATRADHCGGRPCVS